MHPEFREQPRGPQNSPDKDRPDVLVLSSQQGYRYSLRQVMSAEKVAVHMTSGEVVAIPYRTPTGVDAEIFRYLLQNCPIQEYKLTLEAMSRDGGLDGKIMFDTEEDACLVFHLIDVFPTHILDKDDLRCQVLRFFAHSEFSNYAIKGDEQPLTSSWWYLFCRLLISLQQVMNIDKSDSLVDTRDQRLLIEDALSCWTGKMTAEHKGFSFDSLLNSLQKISQEDRGKIADALRYVGNFWHVLVSGYQEHARNCEIISSSSVLTRMGDSPEDSEYVEQFLQESKKSVERNEAINGCMNAFEPTTPLKRHQWDFPVESVANLVQPNCHRVIIHGVHSSIAQENIAYSEACAVQIATCRALIEKGFTSLVLELHAKDQKLLKSFLVDKKGWSDQRPIELFLNPCVNNQTGQEKLIPTTDMSVAESQVIRFINDLALLNQEYPNFQCEISTKENITRARLAQSPSRKRPTIYITKGLLHNSAKVGDNVVRIVHQHSVPKIDVQDEVSGHDVVGYAFHALATNRSCGWGEYTTSFVEGCQNYALQEFLEGDNSETVSGVSRWLTQSEEGTDLGIADGIMVTGWNEGEAAEMVNAPQEVLIHSPKNFR